jgi:hypothetical protein
MLFLFSFLNFFTSFGDIPENAASAPVPAFGMLPGVLLAEAS